MSSFNARLLEDRARDVDPDLRFMAVDDFRRHLNSPGVPSVAFFLPHLFRLLHDSAPAVQDHAVRAFPAAARHLPDAAVVQMVAQLFAAVDGGPAREARFSKSSPTLALRGVFHDAHARFSPPVARAAADVLVPRLVAAPPSIDRAQIAHSLVASLGFALTAAEVLALARASVAAAFAESGVVGAASVGVVGACLAAAPDGARVADAVVAAVLAADPARTPVFFAVLHAVLRGGAPLAAPAPLFARLVHMLRLDAVAAGAAPDFDLDAAVRDNAVRAGALSALASLVPALDPGAFLHAYAAPVFAAVAALVAYNPSQDSADDSSFSDDDMQFDDIEQLDDADDLDVAATKVRLHAVHLLRAVLAGQPSAVPLVLSEGLAARLFDAIADPADAVSEEAVAVTVALAARLSPAAAAAAAAARPPSDASMATESGSPFTALSRYVPVLEDHVFASRLVAKRIASFARSEELVRCLTTHFSDGLSDEFLPKLYSCFARFKLTLKSDSSVVRLYQAILETYELDAIPRPLLDWIVSDLGDTLLALAPYNRASGDILGVCSVLYRKVAHSPSHVATMNSVFFPALAAKVASRQYSGDRRSLLSSLCELVVQIPLSDENSHKCVDILYASLGFELTVAFTIDSMIEVCRQKPEVFSSPELFHRILSKLTAYLSSSDSSLYMCSLNLLKTLFESTDHRGTPQALEELQAVLFTLSKQSEMALLNNIFIVLGHTLATTKANEEFCIKFVTQVMNAKLQDVDDANTQPLEYLTTQLAQNNLVGGERLYGIGAKNLSLKHFASARFLASVAIQCQLEDAICSIENELNSELQQKRDLSIERIAFDIHFLGCVSAETELQNVSFDTFFGILNTHTNDQVRMAAARALGLCISQDFERHLPTLLRCYESSANDFEQKPLILVAIKQVLKRETARSNIELLRTVWSTVFGAIAAKSGPLIHQDVAELKLAGDILSKISEIDSETDYQQSLGQYLANESLETCNEHLIYTIVAIVKQLLGFSGLDISVGIVEKMTQFLPRPSLELKSAIVSSLLTGVYNKYASLSEIVNAVILPKIYDELSAKAEFKKVIPMGPYKYVVDEGLEVRKLSYELISAIINVEQLDRLDSGKMFEILSAKGLNDSENDIINLAIFNLTQLINADAAILEGISFHQDLVASLTKVINRKLRSKASTQETESYEDTIRTVIKFSKLINDILVANSAISNSWSTYYHELRNKHHLLFSSNQE